jgi:hypothetical protein
VVPTVVPSNLREIASAPSLPSEKDPDLAQIVANWANLPASMRTAITAMVGAIGGANE